MFVISVVFEGYVQKFIEIIDFWYNVVGVLCNFIGVVVGSGGGYCINLFYDVQFGYEFDFVVGYLVIYYVQFEFGFSWYFCGDYIKQFFCMVGLCDVSYVYFQFMLNF